MPDSTHHKPVLKNSDWNVGRQLLSILLVSTATTVCTSVTLTSNSAFAAPVPAAALIQVPHQAMTDDCDDHSSVNNVNLPICKHQKKTTYATGTHTSPSVLINPETGAYQINSNDLLIENSSINWNTYIRRIDRTFSHPANRLHHSFDYRLTRSGKELLEITSPDGTRETFARHSQDFYIGTGHAASKILRQGSLWNLFRTDGSTISFKGPVPVSMTTETGERWQYRYAGGLLRSLTDTSGRRLVITYDNPRSDHADQHLRIRSVSLGDQQVDYHYSAQGLERIVRSDSTTTLSYLDGSARLALVSHDALPSDSRAILNSHSEAQTLHFQYDEHRLVAINTPTQTVAVFNHESDDSCLLVEPESTTKNESDHQCQREKGQKADSIAGAVFLDITVNGCLSYFDAYAGIRRGNELENALEQHVRYSASRPTPRWFPFIDFLAGSTAIASISHDLTSASYSSSSDKTPLYDRLVKDGERGFQQILKPLRETGSFYYQRGQTEMSLQSSEIDAIRMELLVQRGTATAGQIREIEQARQTLATRFGITLVVVEIP